MTSMPVVENAKTWGESIPSKPKQMSTYILGQTNWQVHRAMVGLTQVGSRQAVGNSIESSTSCLEWSSREHFHHLWSVDVAPTAQYLLRLPGNVSDLQLLDRVIRNLRQYFSTAVIAVLTDALQEYRYSINIVGESEEDLDQLEEFYLNWWFKQAESYGSTVKFVLR